MDTPPPLACVARTRSGCRVYTFSSPSPSLFLICHVVMNDPWGRDRSEPPQGGPWAAQAGRAGDRRHCPNTGKHPPCDVNNSRRGGHSLWRLVALPSRPETRGEGRDRWSTWKSSQRGAWPAGPSRLHILFYCPCCLSVSAGQSCLSLTISQSPVPHHTTKLNYSNLKGWNPSI